MSSRSGWGSDGVADRIEMWHEGGGARTSLATIEQPALGDYIIAVDGHAEGQGPFVLNIRGELPDGAGCVAPGEGPPPAIGCARGRVCRCGRGRVGPPVGRRRPVPGAV